ncbi:uncharacterized protein LOC142544218 [Primulina tabacum]|uniref:uncharacterized protein LOC142544218 n=1 Tax=Primulina tabacum TaxID=48773 RepID=UPI003F596A70
MHMHYKLFKQIISNKKRFADFENVTVSEECSNVIQRKLPQKLKDPKSFRVPCAIEGQSVISALCDIKASVNLMHISVHMKLGLTEMKPTKVMVQLVDRLVKFPCGLVEDILVNIDKLILPAHFFVLDIEEDHQFPIILGEPFLAATETKKDVKLGELGIEVEGVKVPNEFNVTKYDASGTFTPSDCPGPESESAGKSDSEGCPNQEACATSPKGPDPSLFSMDSK